MEQNRPMAGQVIWITGLAGAGKTTVARLVRERMQFSGAAPILLDGDTLRDIFGQTSAFDRPSRLALASQYGRLCRELSLQGFDVICATISMFDAVRAWNRKNMPRYFEVYLRVPASELRRRDQKGLYSQTAGDTAGAVVGLNQDFEEPKHADLVIDHHGDTTPAGTADAIVDRLKQAALLAG